MSDSKLLPAALGPLPPATVLVVDDSVALLEVLQEHLWQLGLKVRTATTGEDALDRLAQLHPDLILLDVMLPGIDGFEVCRRLKRDPQFSDVPVLFMTSLHTTEDKLHGFQAGGVDYITKPLEYSEVLARVAAHLRLRTVQQQLRTEISNHQQTERQLREREVELQQRTDDANRALDQLLRGDRLAMQDKLATIGQLSAGIAHEINNPALVTLASANELETQIVQFHQFLIELAGPDADREAMGAIETRIEALRQPLLQVIESNRRVVTIAQDLRQFARQDQPAPQPARPIEALRSTLSLVATRFGHNVDFLEDFAADPSVECRIDRLNQVFMNLLVNACQATMERKPQEAADYQPTVKLSSRQESEHLIIDVEDNGIGMQSEVVRRLFEPFFTTKSAEHGSGLGLAVSRSIVKEHAGKLDVWSEPGRGSRFTLQLPLRGSNFQSDDAD